MKINKVKKKNIEGFNLYNLAILIYICMLYSFYEGRILAELILFYILAFYSIKLKKMSKAHVIYIIWTSIFISICLLSILWSKDIQQSIIQTRIMLECAIVGNMIIMFVNTEKKLIFMYKSFVVAGVTLFIRVAVTIPMNMWGTTRIATESLNPNTIGMYMVISILCSMQLIKIEKKKIYGYFIILFTIIALLTGSRKALLMLFTGMLLLYYTNSQKISTKIKSILIIATMSIIAYNLIMSIPQLYDVLGIRIEEMINTFRGSINVDYSTRERLSMISIGKSLYRENPMLGYGIGSYSYISKLGKYAHNNYIELLVGVGLVGTISYYIMYIFIVIKLFIVRKKCYANVLLVFIILLSIIDYGLVSYSEEIYQLIIAISIAAIGINKSEIHTVKEIK